MAPRGAGDPGQGRDAENIALSGRGQDTRSTTPHARPGGELVLIEHGIAIEAAPIARGVEVRPVDFARNVAGGVDDFAPERLTVAIIVRDTPRPNVRAAVRELLALGVDSDALQVHRVEPSRAARGGR